MCYHIRIMAESGSSIFTKNWFRILMLWGISFGGIVGWSSFVMPGTMFLPVAGPLGTVIAMLLGGVVIAMIAANFHNMMNHKGNSGTSGGVFSYTKEVFGYDYSLICVWSMFLGYVSIMWTNASAFTLFARYLFGPVFQHGFCYTIAGYDVWMGEILVTIAITVLFGILCAKCYRIIRFLQTSLAALLFISVALCFFLALIKGGASLDTFRPLIAQRTDGASHPLMQILNIVGLSPWIFIGFCVVSLLPGRGEFSDGSFPLKKSFSIMAAAILCGTLTYIFLALLAPLSLPEGCATWRDYINNLSSYKGLSGIPTFNSARNILGRGGVVLLSVGAICALLTGILSMYRASAQLLQSLADDDVLPAWLGKTSKSGLATNATLFIMLFSLVIPFFGRTATGWIVDVTTITASISYAFVSAASFVVARRDKKPFFMVTGIVGVVTSVFCVSPIIPTSFNPLSLSKEAHLLLSLWAFAGLLMFRTVFARDKKNRFGSATIMWVAMLFIVLISSAMWQRQTTYDDTEKIIFNVSEYHQQTHEDEGIPMTGEQIEREQNFMEGQMENLRGSQFANTVIQFALIFFSVIIMLNIFTTQKKRENQLNADKRLAEEASRAKSVFLSNMSHDIRTPMNAIIGYIALAKKQGTSEKELRGYLSKVESSSQHLLALINDVLEMSRIESGKMDLEEAPCDLKKLMEGVRDMFATQMSQKNIVYTVTTGNIRNQSVLCDKNRLNRVLLNLISNAFKFTPEGGSVYVALEQKDDSVVEPAVVEQRRNIETNNKKPVETTANTKQEVSINSTSVHVANYELRVKDSGIGMSKEFAAKVFEAFERERTSTVSGIQGTGLGMAITKSIVDLMGGEIRVETELGEGTEFIVSLAFKVLDSAAPEQAAAFPEEIPHGSDNASAKEAAPDFTKMRLLLVDDMDVNREIAAMLLQDRGFTVEQAVNGQEAVDKVRGAAPWYYDAVLMDIQMPVMNGHDATRAIRALDGGREKVPVIAMTANAFEEDRKAALDAGMNAHVAKPINEEQLFSTLAAVLS